MDKIQKISSYLVIVFNVLMVAVPLFTVIQWFFIQTLNLDSPLTGFSFLSRRTIETLEGYVSLGSVAWTPQLKLLGFTADIVGLLPFLISLFILKAIFKNYQKGEVFSVKNAIFYRRLGGLFLLDALIIKSLSGTLLLLAVTFPNPPGHRYISIGFGTPNLIPLFYGVLIITVSMVMLEASKIYEEQKFTI